MDPGPAKYAPRSDADVLALVRDHPFAWVVSESGGFSATPLPLRPALDGEGRLVALIGHFARSNPQLARLRAAPRALMLFMGAHGYVSPSWMADRTQAPTWNYAAAAFACDLTFVEDAAGIEAMLRELVGGMEVGRANAWSVDEMGRRYAGLSRGVVGFRAEIRERKAIFKLGQDERDDVFADILAGLDAEGSGDLAALMRAFAAGRSPAAPEAAPS